MGICLCKYVPIKIGVSSGGSFCLEKGGRMEEEKGREIDEMGKGCWCQRCYSLS